MVLREQGYSYAAIAALAWLQLPWQLKVLWAKLQIFRVYGLMPAGSSLRYRWR